LAGPAGAALEENQVLPRTVIHPLVGRFIGRVTRLVVLPATLLTTSSNAWSDMNGPSQASPPRAAPVGALLRDERALGEWVARLHAEVRAADARITQAQADVSTSRLVQNPTLDTTLGGLTVGPRNPTTLSFGETMNVSVGLTQTIELGKRGPRIEAAELRAEAAKRAFAGTLADRIADARLALGRVTYLEARRAVLTDGLLSAKKGAELEKARLDQGGTSGNDYDRMLLDVINLETEVARARAEVDAALASCQGALFAACDTRGLDAADLDAAAPLPGAGTPADLTRRPDIEATRLEGAAAEQDAILARRRAIPDPSVRLGYLRDNLTFAGNQANTLSIGVSIPLPIFDRGQHDARKAIARSAEQRHLADAMVSSAEAGLRALSARRAFLDTTLSTLAATAIPKSASVLDTTSKAFAQGQVGLTDLLLARRAHLALVLTQLDLRFDFFSVRNELRRVLFLDEQRARDGASR
jgi:cobalt-zinc-cadmium efflux system outer membrane protein